MPLVNGGRVVKKKPQEDESISFKAYPVSVANDGTGVGQFISGTATTTADPSTVVNYNSRRTHRITLTWRDDLPGLFSGGTAAVAGTTIPAGVAAYRVTAVNTYCTSYKPSFDDKLLSADVTFKWAPYDKNGASNKKEESTFGAGLGAVGTSTITL